MPKLITICGGYRTKLGEHKKCGKKIGEIEITQKEADTLGGMK